MMTIFKKRYIQIIIFIAIIGAIAWAFKPKILNYYSQLTKPRVGLTADLRPKEQIDAHFVGSINCKKCHEQKYKDWKNSRHSKMIQDAKKEPSVIVADFSKLPKVQI